MAGTLFSIVMKQLGSIMLREGEQKVRLVMGVEEEVRKLQSNLTAIQAVLADAETKQVKDATVRDRLEKLKHVAYDIEDVLDDWEVAFLDSKSKPGDEQDPQRPLKKVRSAIESAASVFKQVGPRHDLAKKIKELNGVLDLLAQQKERYQFIPTVETQQIERSMTTSMIDTEVKGREEDKDVLVKKLLSGGSDLRVLSIVGTGGIGKTTLAQFALDDRRIEDYFDKKIWVCVSDTFNEIRVARAILRRLVDSPQSDTELEDLMQKISESIKKEKILLILDDVWEDDWRKWNKLKQPLRHALPGSKVLVTTQKMSVASAMNCSKDDILQIKYLSDGVCWSILSKIAFFGRNDTERVPLEAIGKKISSKCKGLPLAAKALGITLQFRKTREEWQRILHSEIWEVEEAKKYVFDVLCLSYYDLPPILKRCFSYCAIFPKDYEINKNELIELWMAQGYLMGKQSDLEIIGEHYFQNLAMRSFFQDFKYDGQRTTYYKMHGMMHDLAQLVARDECLGVQINGQVESIMGSVSRKVRHLSLECTPSSYSSTSSFYSFDGTEKLRSLLINWLRLSSEDLTRLFNESTHVRSLSLRFGHFAKIPPSIRKLVLLRWLDLSWNDQLEQLPETLCELHNLQTIDVSGCSVLEKLPLEIEKLINLRHLHNGGEGPSRLPKGIGKLTSLRTLEEVDVGCDDNDAFSLGDLKSLNQLHGTLTIDNLGAYNHHVGEAKEAELKKKEHITELALSFSDSRGGEEEEELLLEALEPSPYLEILEIYFYRGTTFPRWMISLTNLRCIYLEGWESCEHLPSLGKLPFLETLRLWDLWGVQKVGQELLGTETQVGDSRSEISASSSSSSSSTVVAFPKLTTLELVGLTNWEEWDDYHNDNNDGTTNSPSITIMPFLLSLSIIDCPRLKALSNYILQNKMLHTLEIRRSHLLEERYDRENGEAWSKISDRVNVIITSEPEEYFL